MTLGEHRIVELLTAILAELQRANKYPDMTKKVEAAGGHNLLKLESV